MKTFAWSGQCFVSVILLLIGLIAPAVSAGSDDGFALIGSQHALEEEGRQYEKLGQYDKALIAYKAAIEMDEKINGGKRGRPYAFMVQVLQEQGKYEEALKELKYLRTGHLKHQYYIDWEKELEAIIQYHQTGEEEVIYKHIEYLRNKYKETIPPNGYEQVFGLATIESILRLYDTIGDCDAGIKFIDECMEYFKQQDIKRYGKYKPGHADEEYLKVRAAFEQDKAEGWKGCAKAKAGEACMGRATKALIQSDYFPW